jgi:low affinity Fe/Cu permease
MIPPAGMAVAAITVMLWIIWSDTIRARRSSPMLYATRVALHLIVSAIFVLNVFRYSGQFDSRARVLAAIAAAVGLFGAAYFTRRLVRRA